MTGTNEFPFVTCGKGRGNHCCVQVIRRLASKRKYFPKKEMSYEWVRKTSTCRACRCPQCSGRRPHGRTAPGPRWSSARRGGRRASRARTWSGSDASPQCSNVLPIRKSCFILRVSKWIMAIAEIENGAKKKTLSTRGEVVGGVPRRPCWWPRWPCGSPQSLHERGERSLMR